MTVTVRSSPLWADMRASLIERGDDITSIVVADVHEVLDGVDEAVVLAGEHKVWFWRLIEYEDGESQLLAWEDMTTAWRESDWAPAVEEALRVAEHGLGACRNDDS